MSQKEDFVLLVDPDDEEEKIPAEKNGDKTKDTKGKWKKRLLYALSFLFLSFLTLLIGLFLLFNGPSKTLRDTLVLSARQHSSIKWLPSLFLSDSTLSKIDKDSRKIITDTLPAEEITREEAEVFQDGMSLMSLKKDHFSANLLIIQDPSRVFVGTASNFQGEEKGLDLFSACEKYGATAGIYGGEYPDRYGLGNGSTPISITYSQGKMVYSGNTKNTFIGLTKDHRLVISEGMTAEMAEELSIRDGVCYKKGSTLINTEEGQVTVYYSQKNPGRAQRTVIGQRADGSILLFTTEKKGPLDLGATLNEVTDIMLSYGATCAAVVDSGSYSQLYYKNWHRLYFSDTLTKEQEKGLVGENGSQAESKKMPTYFLVGEVVK